MSCGTKLEGRFYSWSERDNLARTLEDNGESRIADRVRHGDCLDPSELHRAERALDHAGMSRYFDYKETRCHCAEEESEW